MQNSVYISGQWSEGGDEIIDNICPSTQQLIARRKSATPDDVSQAIKAAQSALKDWSRRPQSDRNAIMMAYAEALKDNKERLAAAISRDMGKVIWDARLEAEAMAGKIAISIQAQIERAGNQHTDVAFGHTQLSHRPHGIMAVLGPFNFSGHLPNGHIVPALLAGNVCIFKPSELAPTAAEIMADCFERAGLPEGCFSILQGGKDTGEALLAAPINGLLFTGSVEAGLYFHKYFAGQPDIILALEMGGNNPLIVWDIADINAASNLTFQSAFITTGQRCSCARRLIIPAGPQGDDIIAALRQLIKIVKIGAADDASNFMGPLVSNQAAQKAVVFQNALIEQGGQSLEALLQSQEQPAFVTPGLIDVTALSQPLDKELFGPLLQVIRVEDLDTAFTAANATRFGLAGGVLSDDPKIWDRAQYEMKAGVLNWNRPTTGASSALPFGGPGHSGNSRPGAYYAADYCAWPQASQISHQLSAIDMPGLAK